MFVVAGGASAAELVKVASFVSPKSIGVTKVIKPWMEKVRVDIGSSAELKGFWGGSLGKSPVKQYELVKNGVADVAWILPGYTAGQFRNANCRTTLSRRQRQRGWSCGAAPA